MTYIVEPVRLISNVMSNAIVKLNCIVTPPRRSYAIGAVCL